MADHAASPFILPALPFDTENGNHGGLESARMPEAGTP
jgi:hypothetical protein